MENKKFVCEVCGKSYKSKTWLDNHMLTKHGDKPADDDNDSAIKINRLVNNIFGDDDAMETAGEAQLVEDVDDDLPGVGGGIMARAAFDIVVAGIDHSLDLNGLLAEDVDERADLYDDVLTRLATKYGVNTSRYPEIELTVLTAGSTYRAYNKRRDQIADESDDATDDVDFSDADYDNAATQSYSYFKPPMKK